MAKSDFTRRSLIKTGLLPAYLWAQTPGEGKTLLIIDSESVASAEGVTFQLNQVTKHPENPVLLPGPPHQWDGLQVGWPGTVLYEPEDGLFRCWYRGVDVVQANRRAQPWMLGYAESTDGVNWTKPDLGKLNHNGFPTNRLLVDWNPGGHMGPVCRNPDRSDPKRRFLSLWEDRSSKAKTVRILASSGDGRNWKQEQSFEVPHAPQAWDDHQLLPNPDSADPNYRVLGYSQVGLPRSWDKRHVRHVGLYHGKDFTSLDAVPGYILGPEKGIDGDVHQSSVSKVGDTFLMLFESNQFDAKPLHGDLKLAVSSDGRSFRRVHKTTPLVPTGPKGMWDANLLVGTSHSMQRVKDEVWIYYFGCSRFFIEWPRDYATVKELRASFFYPTAMGLATLPLDRYASATGPGTLKFKPIEIGSGGLWLNAEGDRLSISATASDGRRIKAKGLGRERQSTVYRRVEWERAQPAGVVNLEIALSEGNRLFSVRY